jgi:catechol 2,3-dioxygenase-like lactoylglutathione lyase family enzyme
MKVKEFAYTAYAVVDVPKARAFYENVLGLKAGSVWESPEMALPLLSVKVRQISNQELAEQL